MQPVQTLHARTYVLKRADSDIFDFERPIHATSIVNTCFVPFEHAHIRYQNTLAIWTLCAHLAKGLKWTRGGRAQVARH